MRALVICLILSSVGSNALAQCRQALTLGLDVSGSVDAREYRLQLDGVAHALRQDDVQNAFLQFPQAPVRFMVFEWSGLNHQRVIVEWTDVTSPATLNHIADQLGAARSVPVTDRSTAIVAAMRTARAELRQQDCWQRTFDISGDGPANTGTHPREATDGEFDGLTINALVIGPENRANTSKDLSNVKTLQAYFESYVIKGPGAFVETAHSYEDFTNAMARKLIRELDAPALSQAQTPRRYR